MMTDTLRPAAPPSLADRVAPLLDRLGQVPDAVFSGLFRVAVGAVFFKSGLTKIASWSVTVQLFADEYRLPLLPPGVAALLGTGFELACPVLLVLGLATRLATVPLIGMTLAIQLLVYPANWAEHLTWLGMLLFLLSRGAGPLSLDRLFAPRLLARHGGGR